MQLKNHMSRFAFVVTGDHFDVDVLAVEYFSNLKQRNWALAATSIMS